MVCDSIVREAAGWTVFDQTPTSDQQESRGLFRGTSQTGKAFSRHEQGVPGREMLSEGRHAVLLR